MKPPELAEKMQEEIKRCIFEKEKIARAKKCLEENPGLEELLEFVEFLGRRPGGFQ